MKPIIQQINNTPLETLILEHKDLIPYIKEKPDMLPLAIDYLDENQKNTLLKHFCESGDLKQVKCLVSNGADIHVDYEYPLFRAVENGYFEIIKYLVSKGADVNSFHEYPLSTAIERGYFEIVKYLVSKGANIQKDTGYLLDLAVYGGHLEILKYIIAQNDEKYEHYDFIEFLLQTAEDRGYLDIVEYLTSLLPNKLQNV